MRLTLIATLLTLGGCFNFGSYQSADTLGEAHHEVAVEGVGVGALATDDSVILPRGSVRYRAGLTDTVDLGARLGTAGVDILSKFQLTDRSDESLVFSIAPEVGGMALDADTLVLRGQVAGLLGFGVSEAVQLVLGPRVHVWYLDVDGGLFDGQGAFLSAGLSAGAYIELGDLVRLVPEVTLVAPFVALNEDGSTFNDAFLLVEGGVALLFAFGG